MVSVWASPGGGPIDNRSLEVAALILLRLYLFLYGLGLVKKFRALVQELGLSLNGFSLESLELLS